MAVVDLSDLLTPAVAPCPVSNALKAVDATYRDQLNAAIAQCAAMPPRQAAPVPQGNIVAAFERLGHNVSEAKLRDHIRGRCACG